LPAAINAGKKRGRKGKQGYDLALLSAGRLPRRPPIKKEKGKGKPYRSDWVQVLSEARSWKKKKREKRRRAVSPSLSLAEEGGGGPRIWEGGGKGRRISVVAFFNCAGTYTMARNKKKGKKKKGGSS